jgi:hypothetical protein
MRLESCVIQRVWQFRVLNQYSLCVFQGAHCLREAVGECFSLMLDA